MLFYFIHFEILIGFYALCNEFATTFSALLNIHTYIFKFEVQSYISAFGIENLSKIRLKNDLSEKSENVHVLNFSMGDDIYL